MRGPRIGGFSLLELLMSLVLLALISATVYGSLMLASDSWDKGEAKSQQTRQMRLAEEFLRQAMTGARPVRLSGAGESPFPFAGASNWVVFPAVLPSRVGGGLYYFKLSLTDNKHPQLILARIIPQYDPAVPIDPVRLPEFTNADFSVLADDIGKLELHYFGSNYQNGPDEASPTWRDRWEDRQQWPVLVRLDFTPNEGPAWPPLIIELKLAGQTACDEIRRAHNMCNAN